MFLQTLLQLNILILATPALAGWSMMPLAQPGAVHSACVVWQYRAAEAVAPKTECAVSEEKQGEQSPLPIRLPPLIRPDAPIVTDQQCAFAVAPTEALVSCNPFPQATRAP